MKKYVLPDDISLVKVNLDNYEQEGIGCIVNKKHPGYSTKTQWMKDRFSEGLEILLLKKGKTMLGFIEYIPIEHVWRPVEGQNYMFIHCLWIYKSDMFGQGLGSYLVNECLKESEKLGKVGVAAVASDGSWLTDMRIYLKNGFEFIEKLERFDLVACSFQKSKEPKIIDWRPNLKKYKGLHLIYADQCPMFAKCIPEIKDFAAENGLEININRINSSAEAKASPSGYGTFCLIYDGEIIADHYISKTRFKNIVTKELGII